MTLHSPPSQALVLAPPAGPALLRRAAEQSPAEKRTVLQMGLFRQKMVASINACIQQGKEKGRTPEASQEALMSELALGLSFINWKKGDEGLQEYWQKFDEVIAIGRTVQKKNLTEPLQALRRKNRADPQDPDEVYSGAVDHALSSVYTGEGGLGFSRESSAIVLAQRCDDYHQLVACNKELGSLDGLLALKDTLKVDERAVQRANQSGQESGLINIIGETNRKVGYLEAAVFCAVFAKRYNLKTSSPFSMSAEYAGKFLADVGDSFTLNKGMMQEYHKACAQCYPDNTEQMWTLFCYYVEEVTDVMRMHKGRIGKNPAVAEMYFPTDRVSAAALKRKK